MSLVKWMILFVPAGVFVLGLAFVAVLAGVI